MERKEVAHACHEFHTALKKRLSPRKACTTTTSSPVLAAVAASASQLTRRKFLCKTVSLTVPEATSTRHYGVRKCCGPVFRGMAAKAAPQSMQFRRTRVQRKSATQLIRPLDARPMPGSTARLRGSKRTHRGETSPTSIAFYLEAVPCGKNE